MPEITEAEYGSCGLRITYPNTDVVITVRTDIQFIPWFGTTSDAFGELSLAFNIDQNGTNWLASFAILKDNVALRWQWFVLGDYDATTKPSEIEVEIYFWKNSISVEVNGQWVYYEMFREVSYPWWRTKLYVKPDATITFTKIERIELCDVREALFVDYETSTQSVLGSIIQQRPVEIWYRGSSTHFTLNKRDGVNTGIHPLSYRKHSSSGMGVSSDALVYGYSISLSQDEKALDEFGFITRLLRLSDLETGIAYAARAQQKIAREKSRTHDIMCRLYPSIQPGDLIELSETLTGTGTAISETMYVEQVSISMDDRESRLSISARDFDDDAYTGE